MTITENRKDKIMSKVYLLTNKYTNGKRQGYDVLSASLDLGLVRKSMDYEIDNYKKYRYKEVDIKKVTDDYTYIEDDYLSNLLEIEERDISLKGSNGVYVVKEEDNRIGKTPKMLGVYADEDEAYATLREYKDKFMKDNNLSNENLYITDSGFIFEMHGDDGDDFTITTKVNHLHLLDKNNFSRQELELIIRQDYEEQKKFIIDNKAFNKSDYLYRDLYLGVEIFDFFMDEIYEEDSDPDSDMLASKFIEDTRKSGDNVIATFRNRYEDHNFENTLWQDFGYVLGKE